MQVGGLRLSTRRGHHAAEYSHTLFQSILVIALNALGCSSFTWGQDSNLALGLAARQAWTTSRVVGYPDSPPPLKLVPAFPDIHLPKLIALNVIPNTDWLLAAEHEAGYGGPSRVWQFQDQPKATRIEQLFLERPEIIYGFAFHPEFEKNRLVFVGCNGRSEALDAIATRVLRFVVDGEGPYRCNAESEQVIIEWKSNGHNGGDLAFGNDGMLYVSAGDATSDSDVDRNGQNLATLPGSMLRIDVDRPQPGMAYSIPDDNPFLDVPHARGEIWAYGLRNPWRVSYDRTSSQLWVGNNGQDLWESVYLVERGANYGWSIMESNHPFHTAQSQGPSIISPATFEHHHSEARSLTGGHVYRGSQFPELVGVYIYGDYSTGTIWGLRHDGLTITYQELLARSQAQISGFGTDSSGEILIADHEGTIYRFAENTQACSVVSAQNFPRLLSQTGLFVDTARELPAAGVIPYSVNSALWSDGAAKKRWLAIPGNETIEFKIRGAWDFPEGSVLVKSFAFPKASNGQSRIVETRLMAKQQGQWYGYSYRWNASQTDAELVEAQGRSEVLDWIADDSPSKSSAEAANGPLSIEWNYPSRSECMVCHSRAAHFVLGVSTEQLNRPHEYATDGENILAPQIETLAHIGLFGDSATKSSLQDVRQLVDPSDTSQSLESRARSYLHANCASCHVNAGGGNSKIVLDYFTSPEKMELFNVTPLHSRLGLSDAKLISPGIPEQSVLFQRISTRGEGQMPPLATHRIDSDAVQLFRDWIESLDD